MDDREHLTDRLARIGTEPVPDATRDAHHRRMDAAARATPAPPRFGRLAVAGAAIIGFIVGSTGFAMAGALPDPAQDVAHDVLAVVQVEVPEGNRGACVSAVAKSDLPKAEKKAAKDACPKGGPPGDRGSRGNGADPHPDDPCRGRPPWAGQPSLTKAERDAMKAERTATCGPDDDAADEVETEDTGG